MDNNNTANRELTTKTHLNALISQVWDVWTKPEHLVNWWGPSGFTTTIHHMNFTEGGEWK
jgi:uncharacterized protein YndB with AHSA1/START domain